MIAPYKQAAFFLHRAGYFFNVSAMAIPPESKDGSLDRLFFALLFVALLALAFFGGAALIYFEIPAAQPLIHAFEGGKAWLEQRQEISEQLPAENTIESAMAHPQVTWDRDKAYNGYTLITACYSTTAYLIDMDGRVVHQWNMPFYKAWPHPPHIAHPVPEHKIYMRAAHLYPNGDLLAIYEAKGDTPYGYGMVKLDKNSNLLWTYNEHANHDLYVDKQDGSIYTLVHHFEKNPIAGLEGLPSPILSDFIVKLSPEGKDLDRISILKAFRDSPYAPMLFHAPKNLAAWDHLHTNSIEKLEPDIAVKFPMFKAGDLLISMRSMNTIAVIDPATRKVVWAYNGLWKAQHYARFLNNGHLLLTDNKGLVMDGRAYSRVIEFDPTTLSVTWSYNGDRHNMFFNENFGIEQRLPNQDTLITDPYRMTIFELDRNDEEVWKYALQVRPIDFPKFKKNESPAYKNINMEEPDDQFLMPYPLLTYVTRYDLAYPTFLKDELTNAAH